MAQFKIVVERIGYAQRTFVVEAKDALQARDLASQFAGDFVFSEKSAVYEIDSIKNSTEAFVTPDITEKGPTHG